MHDQFRNAFLGRGVVNTFVANGVVCGVMGWRRTKAGFNVRDLVVEVTDEMSNGRKYVPFGFRDDKSVWPEGVKVGDVVNVTFRLYGFDASPYCGKKIMGVKLTAMRCDIVHHIDDYATPAEENAFSCTACVQDDETDDQRMRREREDAEFRRFLKELRDIEYGHRSNKAGGSK